MFSELSKKNLIQAAIFKNKPIYVQFYITARCNLTCQQCNIIYANSDTRECTIDEIKLIGDNLAEIGTAIILLTGGEPFVRKDLPEIIEVFESRNIHVRMQTNGLASEEMIQKSIESGGKDISISLDTLNPDKQDVINGGFKHSWYRAIEKVSLFTKYLPVENSFASFGCVLQPLNIEDIVNVIKFGTEIGWYTSLVPIHVTSYKDPMGFRTFDKNLKFTKDDYLKIDNLLSNIKKLRNDGYLLYDSDQYLEDISRFTKGIPMTWRHKNDNVCDSPNLYFAILPNGDFAPCCDHRLKHSVQTFDKKFSKIYKNKIFRKNVLNITSNCEGCMYGSYPEMTISMRYMAAQFQRFKTFFSKSHTKNWPYETQELIEKSKNIEDT